VEKFVEGGVLSGEGYESGCYVKPAIAEEIIHSKSFNMKLLLQLYLLIGNCRGCFSNSKRVAQGLSSAIMTNNLREAELFLSVVGSDCGLQM
jgi:aldehyde dehydrogenase (NAD+)